MFDFYASVYADVSLSHGYGFHFNVACGWAAEHIAVGHWYNVGPLLGPVFLSRLVRSCAGR